MKSEEQEKRIFHEDRSWIVRALILMFIDIIIVNFSLYRKVRFLLKL